MKEILVLLGVEARAWRGRRSTSTSPMRWLISLPEHAKHAKHEPNEVARARASAAEVAIAFAGARAPRAEVVIGAEAQRGASPVW